MEQLNISRDYPFSSLTLDQKANMLIMSTFLLCHLLGCCGSLQRWASYWVPSKWLQRQKLCAQGYQRAALQRWQHQNRLAEPTKRWTVLFSVFHIIKCRVNLLKVICLLVSQPQGCTILMQREKEKNNLLYCYEVDALKIVFLTQAKKNWL